MHDAVGGTQRDYTALGMDRIRKSLFAETPAGLAPDEQDRPSD